MDIDEDPFPRSRSELGIPDNAVVFTIVSRAIPDKGWLCAVEARAYAAKNSKSELFLLLVGTGESLDALKEKYREDTNVLFLGFQSKISGIYRLSDCAMLPTRFPGESYPLTLNQALQVGRPIIATEIGEIPKMLTSGNASAGILVEPSADNTKFILDLAIAMVEMADPVTRLRFAASAEIVGRRFDIGVVGEKYIGVYEKFTGD